MCRVLRLLLLFLACMPAAASAATPAHGAEYKIGAAPDWVAQMEAPAFKPPPKGEAEGEVAYLLIDKQVKIDDSTKATYTHHVAKAVDTRGLEDIANINIEFDPAYQSVTLHGVRVLRDGKSIDKLADARIHVLQRERELEYLIYDGSKTINIVLQDVRVGDLVDYSYSIQGNNPVFGGKVSGGTELQWSVPVGRVFVRLLAPEARDMRVTLHHTTQKLQAGTHDGMREYRVLQDDVLPAHPERDAPDWYDPYAAIQWSDYADWPTVAHWALPLYRPGELGAPLQREIDRIAREHPDQEGRLLAALRLVQHDIRYLGIEAGAASHAPTAPAVVYARRFGDCKDKTTLLTAVLRALGVDAKPALVNTREGKGIADMWPTPAAFDHAIVRATIQGRQYWLDATRSPQMGDLDHLFQPDFGLALVIDDSTTALVEMNPPHPPKRTVRVALDAHNGIGEPVAMTVMTTMVGKDAERLLADLASDGKNAMAKRYLNYYANSYAGIRQTAALEITQDEHANSVTIVERYEIPDFWEYNEKTKRHQAAIRGGEVDDEVNITVGLHRNAPLGIAYPHDIEQTTVLTLPEKWKLHPYSNSIDDPAFHYTRSVTPSADGRSVTIVDSYSAKADHVDIRDLASYSSHLEAAHDDINYRLWKDDEDAPASKPAVPTATPAPASAPASAELALMRASIAVILLSLWAIAAMLYVNSLPLNKATNRKLLWLFIGDSIVAAIFFYSDLTAGLLTTAYVSIISLYSIGKIKRDAPETHWLHAPGNNARLQRVLHWFDRVLWLILGMLLMKTFSE